MPASNREVLFAGAAHRDPVGDLRWVLKQPGGNVTIRLFCLVLRKIFRQTLAEVTFDEASFRDALAAAPANVPRIILPVHRSYYDFLFCSYLFHARQDLNIPLPHIAAAEEFGQMPVLGTLLKQAGAFYIRRGVGKEDVQLSEHVDELVRHRQTFEFFVEGTRSRSRQFLPPKRGLLRALQRTGERFALFPIAITYDRVPEERTFADELGGAAKTKMTLSRLWRWRRRAARGEIQLGRMHIHCAEPLELNADTDVRALSQNIVGRLQQHTGVTPFHLGAFLQHVSLPGVELADLEAAIRTRGGQLLRSPLDPAAPENAVHAVIERSLRYHWLHHFVDEALARWPDDPALTDWAERHRLIAPVVAASPAPAGLLEAAFEPIRRDYARVAQLLSDHPDLPAANAIERIMKQHPDADLPTLENAIDFEHKRRSQT